MRRFTFPNYLRDKWLQIALAIAGIAGLGLTLSVMGLPPSSVICAASFVATVLLVMLAVEFLRKRAFWRRMAQAVEASASASDLPSLIDEPTFLEGEMACDAIEKLGTLSNRELSQAKQDAQAYREYIELWIHETKIPLAGAKLVAQRAAGEDSAVLLSQIERIERQIDQALYYARSATVANDYEIREVPLAKTCREACKRNARFLIDRGCTPAFDIPEEITVLADKPWLLFMLGQIVVNSAKYGASHLRFSALVENEGTPHGRTVLTVADDGCGIAPADVPRVFERGFTGTNGRTSETATGMGLYLVARMCESLGIGVHIASEEGTGTRVVFAFPHNRGM